MGSAPAYHYQVFVSALPCHFQCPLILPNLFPKKELKSMDNTIITCLNCKYEVIFVFCQAHIMYTAFITSVVL